jgi:hypothetical protein
MNEPNLPSRRYDDAEIARLFKRATELQARDPQQAEHDGMTLQELEAVAREAGIDPVLLQQAASELDHAPESGGWGPLLAGERTSLVIERSFEGELDQADLEGLVPYVNLAADLTGNISSVGRTLNFSGGGQQSTRSIQVLVSSRHGRTDIRIEERYGQLLGALFGGIVGGAGVGLGVGLGAGVGAAMGSAILAVGLPFAALGGTYAIARFAFKKVVARRRRALRKLVDQVGAVVAEHNTRRLSAGGDGGD